MADFQSWSQGREVRWNSHTLLPPVGCWLWIRLPDSAPVRVKRKSWMTSADGTPEYTTEDGSVIAGKFNWTID